MGEAAEAANMAGSELAVVPAVEQKPQRLSEQMADMRRLDSADASTWGIVPVPPDLGGATSADSLPAPRTALPVPFMEDTFQDGPPSMDGSFGYPLEPIEEVPALEKLPSVEESRRLVKNELEKLREWYRSIPVRDCGPEA